MVAGEDWRKRVDRIAEFGGKQTDKSDADSVAMRPGYSVELVKKRNNKSAESKEEEE